MFRKPMRLEKWIAFDGAVFVDVVAAANDTDADAHSDINAVSDQPESGAEAPDCIGSSAPAEGQIDHTPQPGLPDDSHGPVVTGILDLLGDMSLYSQTSNTLLLTFSSFPQYDGLVSLVFPIGLDRPEHFDASGLASYTPFMYDNHATFTIDAGAAGTIQVTDLYLGVTFPENGSFTLFDIYGSQSLDSFVNANHIPVGSLFAYTFGDVPSSGIYTGVVRIGVITETGPGHYGIENTDHVAVVYNYGDSIRFGFVNDARPEHVAAVINSLVYTPGAQQSEGGNAFSVSLFHDMSGTAYSVNKLIVGSGCAFVATNSSGTIQDATQACDTSGAVLGGNGGGDPDPGVDPDPGSNSGPHPGNDADPGSDPGTFPGQPGDPDPEPDADNPGDTYVPPHAGGNDSDWDGGGSDWDSGGSEANAGDDLGGDGVDDIADVSATWYVPVEEDIYGEEEDPGTAADGVAAVNAVVVADGAVGYRPDLEGANPGDELLRDVEVAILGVRAVNRALENALTRLEREYSGYPVSSWPGPARERLREMFAFGGGERRALDRASVLLVQQTDTFRKMPPDRRDGVLQADIREMSDAAAKRSGEATALAKALERVADVVSNSRTSGGVPPEGEALAEVFGREHAKALAEWRERAGLRDAMGKELESYTRLHAAAK